MKLSHTLFFFPLAACVLSPALAVDQINRVGGGSVLGTITLMTPREVTIVTTAKKEDKIAVNTIESIRFDGEPAAQMGLLRSADRTGNYASAKKSIDQLSAMEISNPNAKRELAYYAAMVEAKLQLATGGKRDQLLAAKKLLDDYLAQYPASWREYEVIETLGDIWVAVANLSDPKLRPEAFANANAQYQKLSQAPWDSHKLRAAILRGRAYQQAGQFDPAKQQYQEVIKLGSGKSDAQTAAQVLSAKVGLAEVLAEASPPEAIKLITEVVAGADPENTQLHAMAFLTLGKCHDKAKNTKEALMNYVKVDVLYFQFAQYHAEALFHLSRLWAAAGIDHPDRAKAAAETLKARYPGSPWAAKLPN
jgi:tetratricopeptide (TPR) repeat protein